MSSAVPAAAPNTGGTIPQGVRLSLQLAQGPMAHGMLTLDWAPTRAGDLP